MKAIGFEHEGDWHGMPYYQTPDEKVKVSYSQAGKSWQMKKDGKVVVKGNTLGELNEALKKHTGPDNFTSSAKPKITKPSQPAPQPDHHSTQSAPVYGGVKAAPSFTHTVHGIADAQGFSGGMLSALRKYTGGNYTNINEAMRFEVDYGNVAPHLMKDILNLQKAFHVVPPTTEDCVVGCKIKLDALKTMVKSAGLNHLSELQEGSIIRDDAIVSTSHSSHVWDGDVKLKIKVPKGSRAIHVSKISIHPKENETLLPPGSRFKINKAQENYDGFSYYLEVELLP
jgi:ribosomal protein L18E